MGLFLAGFVTFPFVWIVLRLLGAIMKDMFNFF